MTSMLQTEQHYTYQYDSAIELSTQYPAAHSLDPLMLSPLVPPLLDVSPRHGPSSLGFLLVEIRPQLYEQACIYKTVWAGCLAAQVEVIYLSVPPPSWLGMPLVSLVLLPQA